MQLKENWMFEIAFVELFLNGQNRSKTYSIKFIFFVNKWDNNMERIALSLLQKLVMSTISFDRLY